MKKTGFRSKVPPRDDQNVRPCDNEGCDGRGDYKAPYDRYHLHKFRWFCLVHIREYNQKWDYFQGLNEDNINQIRTNDMSWQRPTWPFGKARERHAEAVFNVEDELIPPLQSFSHQKDAAPKKSHCQDPVKWFARNSPEASAVHTLELQQPISFEQAKVQYKILVKTYHPDVNDGCDHAQEKIKLVNSAYHILKLAFQKN